MSDYLLSYGTGGDIIITSTGNEKIKNVMKCMKQSKERRKQKVFLVEGIRMFSEIPRDKHVESFATEEFYETHTKLFDGLPYELVSDNVMKSLADTRTPQGIISVVKQMTYNLEQVCGDSRLSYHETHAYINGDDNGNRIVDAKENGDNGSDRDMALIIVLENIQDPGNLGTIIRTAEGAGVTGIIMSKDTVDIYNPKVVRSTMGSIFRVPFIYVENLTDCVRSLGEKGFNTYSAHLQGTSFYDYDYKKSTIFVLGNEGKGLSEEVSAVTEHKIFIPMMGQVESLNVATAGTVLMYETMRQRNTLF